MRVGLLASWLVAFSVRGAPSESRLEHMRKRVINLVGACLSAAVLTACGGNSVTTSMPMPAVSPLFESPSRLIRTNSVYSNLHDFNGTDGAQPHAGLINAGGTLYGTTFFGGSGGTVFKITTSGTETVLHKFGNGNDGALPASGLVNVGGTLYGTTYDGGAHAKGTVFTITTSGTETVLHSFGNGNDGANPVGGLINVGGTLYGTTDAGGANNSCTRGCGTVFTITTSGAERVLYSFKAGTDGANPGASLINLGGTLYGTTLEGGDTSNKCFSKGCGTVFEVTTSGAETVLHRFVLGNDDGAYPYASLINVGGTLYGTTYNGGASSNCSLGCGTVFEVTTSGMETVLHSFSGGGFDGAGPMAGLINVGGTLYSTTQRGGAVNSCTGGCGTVFKITPYGTETVLHNCDQHGSYPGAGLLNVNGTLYSTTENGGAHGDGTVFSLTP